MATSIGWQISLVCGLAFFVYGYDQGDLAGLLTIDTFRSTFPNVDTLGNSSTYSTALLQGVTVGAWNIACFISAILTIVSGDYFGRKVMITTGLLLLLAGEIIQASSFSFGQFVTGRVIAGLGNGFTTATVPAWQAECTKAHQRGTLLMISAGACIAAGLSFSYWVDFALSYVSSSAAWRAPITIQLLFILIGLVIMHRLPESPRWLILTGREERAMQTLALLSGSNITEQHVRDEFLAIKDAVLELSKADFTTTFSMGDYRHLHRVVLAVLLQIFQQLTGINLITQYLPLMLIQQFRYDAWLARLMAACGGTAFFLASFVAVIGIDRFWGRRSLMLFGATGMCSSMVVLCIMTYLNTFASLIVGTAFLLIFTLFFAIGWQGMSWLYAVEVVPLRIRAPANAISTACNWLVNWMVVLVTPIMFYNIGYRTYIVFAVTNFVMIPVIYLLYPETGFRSLEEVDVIFHTASLSSKPWLNVRHIAEEQPLWYGRRGEAVFDYEQSIWHQQHIADQLDSELKYTSGSDDQTITRSTSNPSSKLPSSPVSPQDLLTSSLVPEHELDPNEACPAPFVPRVSIEHKQHVKRSSWRS